MLKTVCVCDCCKREFPAEEAKRIKIVKSIGEDTETQGLIYDIVNRFRKIREKDYCPECVSEFEFFLKDKSKEDLYEWMYMSDIEQRLKNAKDYFEEFYRSRIKRYDKYGFYTDSFHIMFINPNEFYPFFLRIFDLKTDRAIIDYRDPMIGIAKKITENSRYDSDKIVDDRKLGFSDNYKGGINNENCID